MKFIHLADLHLGKTLHGYSLIDQGDQTAWVDRFLEIAAEIRPDAVLIAGDVYDRSVPPREAVDLLDKLLTRLSAMGIAVLLIAGNHDSGPRLNFASSLLEGQNVHISGNVQKNMRRVTLFDAFGPVHFYLMPYIFPAAVEEALGCEEMRTYDAAARALLEAQEIDIGERNVILAHQLVLCGKEQPEAGGSETMVGGVGQIDVSAFDAFDYVALGHIHRAQAMGRSSVRYAGSPLCYHFSEIGSEKGPLLIEMGRKGETIDIKTITIEPVHPLREIRGELSQILDGEAFSDSQREYIRVVLTDKTVPAGAVESLSALFRAKGSFLMEVAREQLHADAMDVSGAGEAAHERSIDELFTEFFTLRTGGDLPDGAEEELIRFAADMTQRLADEASADDIDSAAQKILEFALKEDMEA